MSPPTTATAHPVNYSTNAPRTAPTTTCTTSVEASSETNSTGSRVNTYSYDPYGKLTSPASAAPVANPWRYNDAYYDTTTGLYHFGARYYDPKLGRFTQADPSGQESNPYLFGGSDPINRSDPSGLTSIADAIGSYATQLLTATLFIPIGVSAGAIASLPFGPEALPVGIGVGGAAAFTAGQCVGASFYASQVQHEDDVSGDCIGAVLPSP